MGVSGLRGIVCGPGLWVAVLFAMSPGLRAQQQAAAPALDAPRAQPGVVHGSVVDADGDALPGAAVVLQPAGDVPARTVVADDAGNFTILNVPVGAFDVTASAAELRGTAIHAEMKPSGTVDLEPIRLSTATANFSVSAVSPHDAAEVEVKAEEQQRLLGVLPNFGISYNWNAPPLDTKQKFELATRSAIDPTTLAVSAGIVLGERWSGQFQEFGTGPSGYWYLYGVTLGDIAVGNELGGAILPTLFHQDPRYFWKGSGTIWSRTRYALTRAVICRGDNGKDQFSWSGVLGDFGAGAFSNIYYPKQDRQGVSLTIINGALDLGADALNNVIQEFLFKHLTPKAKDKVSNAPVDTPKQ